MRIPPRIPRPPRVFLNRLRLEPLQGIHRRLRPYSLSDLLWWHTTASVGIATVRPLDSLSGLLRPCLEGTGFPAVQQGRLRRRHQQGILPQPLGRCSSDVIRLRPRSSYDLLRRQLGKQLVRPLGYGRRGLFVG